MTAKYAGVDGYIWNTPLIRLRRLSELTGCEILGKSGILETACPQAAFRFAGWFNCAAMIAMAALWLYVGFIC